MVWVEGGRAPAKRHDTTSAAKEEAVRLCKQEGSKVFVMVDAWMCEPAETPVRWSGAACPREPDATTVKASQEIQ